MTVASTTSKVSYAGDGATTTFTVPFYFLDQTHIKVTYRVNATATETVKTLTTDYTVSGAGVAAGGSITTTSAPAAGITVVIQRNVPLTQETSYQPNDPFPAKTHEAALDKLTMETQQLNEAIARSIKLSTTNTMTSTEFTVGATDRANKVLGFDSAGELSVAQELGTYKGNWATATAYSQRALVKDTSNNNIYICVTAHTSSGSQPISTNTDAAKWALIVDAASATSSATAAASSATSAASSATAAASSATSASSSASSAGTSATTATTQASNASTSASAAATSATNASNSATAASASAAAAAASAASGLYRQVLDKTSNYTIVSADGGTLFRASTGSGAITFTLPQISTVTDGFKVAVVKWTSDANQVTVSRSGSDTINGATSVQIGSQYSQIILVADFETNTWFASQSGLGATNMNVDVFSGNGSTTVFTLTADPGSKNNTNVYISGVYQAKSTYSVSGTTLTFSTAPPSGTSNIEVDYGTPLAVGTPSDGTVTTAKLVDGAVTIAKLSASGSPDATNFLRGDGSWTGAGYGSSSGDIIIALGTTKTGYLLCDGSVYTRASYAALATAIGSPISPSMTLGNALSGSLAGNVYGVNNLLFKSGSASSTTATVANGIQTSSDGITWTMRTGMNIYPAGNNGIGNAVSYGNSVYVCAVTQGANNTLYWQTSADAITYTARSLSFGTINTTVSTTELAYGGTSNRHVMQVIWNPQSALSCGTQTSTNARLMYSADGITWTTADTITDTSNPNTYFSTPGMSVAGYSGGFVATALLNVNGGTYTNYIKYSADGATWTDITSNINSVAAIAGKVSSVSYANGKFILSFIGGQIYTSTTGASGSWSLVTTANSYSTTYVGKISGNANAYFITGTGYLSTDLINWFSMPNVGLGTPKIQVGFSGATRFFGLSSNSTVSAYYIDLWNYTVATQFVVPKINTYSTGGQSSPFAQNMAPVNYFIKT